MEQAALYCDESCHLEHDRSTVMVLGTIWCPDDVRRAAARDIRRLKTEYGLSREFELKWSKVSPARIDFYLAVIGHFFSDVRLHYRGVTIQDKSRLNHQFYEQTHDDFYYKMWFYCLRPVLDRHFPSRIFLDIKDTKGSIRVEKLRQVLCRDQGDFSETLLQSIQLVRSHEVELLQVADFLSGALSYFHRGLAGSQAKISLIRKIQEHTGFGLGRNTKLGEEKFNLFVWTPR